MKPESCAEITNTGCIGLKNGLTEPGEKQRNFGYIIPAGILIGLGVGMLFDHMGVGFLIGLGLGFLGSELLPLVSKSQEGGYLKSGGANVTTVLIGTFLILIGISFVWAPAAIWPYTIAGFLILAGAWFLVRGSLKVS